jgi:hypothetical protein
VSGDGTEAEDGTEIERLRRALAVERAKVAGLRAQVLAAEPHIRRHAPELAAPGGETVAGGALGKSAFRLIYDRAFDATLRKHGIDRPEDYRD